MNYYNEIDHYATQWLRNLIEAGHIPKGEVDERSIADVRGHELKGYTQCHFFAGIGGWSRALELAGWPEDRPVWTGSCPCQPFSVAGRGAGINDERHLWPEFYRLISECGPPTVFGEQVASKDGKVWLSRVRADLEVLGYAVGAADLCAAGADAEHIRQRLWWVAHASGKGLAGSVGERQGIRGITGTSSTELRDPSVSERLCHIPHPSDLPAAHGIPRPVGSVRAYGNAIVPQVAAEFILAAVGA